MPAKFLFLSIQQIDLLHLEVLKQFGGADGLRDRGLLRPGLAADVTIFDAATITDRASFETPAVYPDGISHVFVNGVAAVTNGRLTSSRSGSVLTA